MIRQGCSIIGVSVLLLSSVAFAQEAETAGAVKTWDNYKVITEKNIFSRNRTKAVDFTQIQQSQVIVYSEQSYYTLRGITKQSNGFVAFLEDSRTSGVTRLQKSATVAEGKISDITLDGISYAYNGKTIKVEIGMNLEGQTVSSGMQYNSNGGNNSQGNVGFSMGQAGGMGQFPSMGQQTQGQFPSMGQQTQGATGQMPGGQTQGGMGQMPGGQTQGAMGQMPGQAAGGQTQGGMGQMPGQASGASTTDQTQGGRGQQGPGGMMGQTTTQTNGQSQSTAQAGRAQGSITMQSQATGQVSAQSQSTGQTQSSGQTATISQTKATVQTGTGQSESSEQILERLKEKRKKELEE